MPEKWSAPDQTLIAWGFPDNTRKFDEKGNVIFEPIPDVAPTRLNAKAPRAGEDPNWFVLRYCEGNLWRISIDLGGGALFRAQLGAGHEAELISTVIPAFFERAATDPANEWGIKPGGHDVTSYHDFLAMMGADFGAALAKYPPSQAGAAFSTDQSHPMPAPRFREDLPEGKVYGEGPFAAIGNKKVWWINVKPQNAPTTPPTTASETEILRSKLADAIKAREDAQRAELALQSRTESLLRELLARSAGMRTAAGERGGGKYADLLRKAAEGVAKTVADFRKGA